MTRSEEPTPILAAPPRLVVPAASVERLRRQWDRRPPGTAAIVAPLAQIEPGSSTTTTAERAAMTDLDRCASTDEVVFLGAALIDPRVTHHVGERTVSIGTEPSTTTDGPAAPVVVDPGACSFDPVATGRTSQDLTGPPPSPRGRPPFRWRPVVLFLAGRSDPPSAEIAAELANALIDLDVEPRLALADPVPGPLLVRPCPARPDCIDVLRPDVIVALDDAALAQAERSCADRRDMVLALLDGELDERVEVVPWTIGVDRGHLRARVGPRAEPAEVARLVNRLCSGPRPGPPTPAGDPVASDAATTSPVAAPQRRDVDPEPGPRFAGWATSPPAAALSAIGDHLEAAGWRTAAPRSDEATVAGARLLLGDTADLDALVAFVDQVEEPPTIVVVTGDDPAPVLGLPPPVRRRCRALAGSAEDAALLRRSGVDSIAVPRLRTRAELAALDRAATHRVRPSVPTIGVVHIGATEPAASTPPALDRLGARTGDVAVVEVALAAPGPTPGSPTAHRSRATLPDPGTLAGWTAGIVLSSAPADAPGALDALATMALVGVPVVLSTSVADVAGSLADPALTLAEPVDPAELADRLDALLDEDRRRSASERARRVATARWGTDAAALVIARVVGWLGIGQR